MLAGAAVINKEGEIIWAQPLGHESSAQKAELIALTEALRKAKGKLLTFIWTPDMHLLQQMCMGASTRREVS